MNAVKIGTWAFVVIVGVATFYLAWLNRASEKVSINLPTALAVSAVGALLTLLFSLQAEQKGEAFAVEYIVDLRTGVPLSCPAFPDSVQYSDAGGFTTSPAWKVAAEVAAVKPRPNALTDDAVLAAFYRDILARQILDTLRFTYLKSWDAQPSRIELPTGGSSTLYAPRQIRPGRQLTNAELMTAMGGDSVADSTVFKFLNLPPDTTVGGAVAPDQTTLRLSNSFVQVDLAITDRGVQEGPGAFRELCRLQFADAEHFRRPRYLIAWSARFAEFRSGHPNFPLVSPRLCRGDV